MVISRPSPLASSSTWPAPFAHHAGVVIQTFVNHDAAIGGGQHDMAITAQRGQVRLFTVGDNRGARVGSHLRHAHGHGIHRDAVSLGDEDARTVAAGAQGTDGRHRGGQVTVTAGDSVIRFQAQIGRRDVHAAVG